MGETPKGISDGILNGKFPGGIHKRISSEFNKEILVEIFEGIRRRIPEGILDGNPGEISREMPRYIPEENQCETKYGIS